MYLKSLEIQGFKSFAEKTKLNFLPPKDGRFSITGIVGPNGSGKSNVVDAIRWVMGEQSLKTLRGKKSEDIIFGGSAARGALGACEISMVLDNSDHRVDIEAEEVVITRRLYRSGEGEYLINSNPVRMLDIHLLLAKAQFGQHSYSIVGQGTIDKMLTVTPAERKDFLDEASGIKEYQIKHHQGSLKLARTEENMTQVDTLLKEVEPRLRLLSKQVRKLEQRQEIEINLREAQEKYYGSLYSSNKSELDKLDKIIKELDENYRVAFKELETVQNELSDLARAESRQEVFVKLQE
ncbi:MAG: AAA family ATPase, partial [Candidatus Magasanikbacteria bacterium]|nr:AAA family ATPase [Candidatus Magasanikbacteria bacterium]